MQYILKSSVIGWSEESLYLFLELIVTEKWPLNHWQISASKLQQFIPCRFENTEEKQNLIQAFT